MHDHCVFLDLCILINAHSAVKSNGGRTDWERIASDLPGRTAEMVRSLYMVHREYLALEEATSLGFFTILKTVYTSLPALLTSMFSSSCGV